MLGSDVDGVVDGIIDVEGFSDVGVDGIIDNDGNAVGVGSSLSNLPT